MCFKIDQIESLCSFNYHTYRQAKQRKGLYWPLFFAEIWRHGPWTSCFFFFQRFDITDTYMTLFFSTESVNSATCYVDETVLPSQVRANNQFVTLNLTSKFGVGCVCVWGGGGGCKYSWHHTVPFLFLETKNRFLTGVVVYDKVIC